MSKITRIEVANEATGYDVSFFFDGDNDVPWGVDEFIEGTVSRMFLQSIETLIMGFNSDPRERPELLLERDWGTKMDTP